MSIADIAQEVGFREPSAFHRAFKQWTGRAREFSFARGARIRAALMDSAITFVSSIAVLQPGRLEVTVSAGQSASTRLVRVSAA
ncbi:AraC family transcriptional regulator [Pseudomonas sp. PCH446]